MGNVPRPGSVAAEQALDRVERIAVLRALPAVGDMVCAVPALRTLRRRYPEARIALVGLWSGRWMLDAYPAYLDELLPIDGLPLLCPPPDDLEGALTALAEARRQHFDLAIQLQDDGPLSNLVTAMLGARRCLVYHRAGQPVPEGSLAVTYPDRGHEVVRLLELVDQLGYAGEAHLEPPHPATQAGGVRLVDELGLTRTGFAVMHPGAAATERRWSVDGFASVAGWLIGRGLAVVATGVEAERDLIDRLRQRQPSIVDLCGRTNITDLAGILSRARIVVSNNSGVAHLAAAVRAPSVVVFLGDDPGRWAPLDSARHRVVPLTHLPQDIDGELAAVIEAVAQQLARFSA